MKKYHTLVFLVLFLVGHLISLTTSYAQIPEITKQRLLRTSSLDAIRVIKITNDGGFIAGVQSSSTAGFDKSEVSRGLNDYWVYKASRSGALQWEHTLGGAQNDNIKSITITSDGGYLLAGESASPISGDKTESSIGTDIWLLKLDSNGNLLWQNTIQASADDSVASVLEAVDGGFYILGTSTSGVGYDKTSVNYGSNDLWLIKINASGNVVWDKGFGGTGADVVLYPELLKFFDNGDLLIASSSSSGISGNKTVGNNGSYDFWLLRCDTAGNVKWQKNIGGSSDDQITDIKNVRGNAFLITSSSSSPASGDKLENYIGYPAASHPYDYWAVKIDTSGTIIWQNTIGGNSDDQVAGAVESDSGLIYLSGISFSGISGDKIVPQIGGGDLWLVILDSLGNLIGQNSWSSSGRDIYGWPDYKAGKCIIGERADLAGSGDILELPHPKGNWNSWIVTLDDRNTKHYIHGHVFADLNNNCVRDFGEPNLYSTFVTNANEERTAYALNGNYSIATSSEDAALYVSNLDTLYRLGCHASDTILVAFNSGSAVDTFNIDFPVHSAYHCLQTEITGFDATFPRICDTLQFNLNFYNNSFDTAYNAFVLIKADTADLHGFHSPSSYVLMGDTMAFSLGNLAPFQTGTITFFAQLDCDADIGTALCQKAWIYPGSNCSTSSAYDSSQVTIDGSCQGDTLQITLTNDSKHDMITSGVIRYYNEEILVDQLVYQLPAHSQRIARYFAVPSSTMTFVVSQNPNHPVQPNLIYQNDKCALVSSPKMNTIFLRFPRYDESYNYQEKCQVIRGSYDPNLKSVVPEGYFSNHLIASDQLLQYRIDFQNTGTDTAFRVEIIDTLSSNLDVKTFIPGASSSPYTVSLENDRIMHFIFYPISLPDSGASQVHSHGYVSFSIKPKSGISKGSRIDNLVDIYFDLNDPVRTNTVTSTVYDTVFIALGIEAMNVSSSSDAVLFPNPAERTFIVKLSQAVDNMDLILENIEGKTVKQERMTNQNIHSVDVSSLQSGTYFLKGLQLGKPIFTKKVVIY
jgi:uncharacterized repeat protein (TIGR01451 family)